MTIQTEVEVKCPHQRCRDLPTMTAEQFFTHLKDNHAVEELRWILTGIEERTERDNRDHLVRTILRNLFSNALMGLKSHNVYSSAELKRLSAPS